MRTRKRRIKLQRFCDSRLCLRHCLSRRRASLLGISEPKVGHRQLCIGRGKSRILLDGLLEVSYRFLEIRFAIERGRDEIQAVQVIILRLRVHGATTSKAGIADWERRFWKLSAE